MTSPHSPFRAGLLRLFGPEPLARLETARVAVAGAGGLGSNCAAHLVRSGVRRLKLCDFDRVDWSNLNRQHYFQDQVGRFKVEALAENLRRINPELELELCRECLAPDSVGAFLDGCGIAVEAFDQAEAKAMLVQAARQRGLPVVTASGLGGYGDSGRIAGRPVKKGLFLVGDGVSEVGEGRAPWSAIVGIAAAKQADAVVEWILNGNWERARRKLPVTDLYGITHSPRSAGRSNPETVRLMLEAGIRIIQYREKDLSEYHKLMECREIRRLCTAHGACFIVNDRPDLALLAEADGLHLGQDDLPLPEVRKLVGEAMILGLSTHSPEQARQALALGADYIGVGPIFRTFTKQGVVDPVGLDYLAHTMRAVPAAVPKVAIGGLKAHNLRQVAALRPDLICLVTEITNAPDIGATVRDLRRILRDA
ncbi:MAG: sulfur carrier protein ThiS adenylyltransferase ThiF [Lentisphaeria bacterium]